MKKLWSLAEGFAICAIIYLTYILWRGDQAMTRLQCEMPLKMQLYGSEGCTRKACLDFLSGVEEVQYDECYNKSVSPKYVKRFGWINEGTCRFQDGASRLPVGLGSFQGSGNTWLRGLLEKVTGICTGNKHAELLNHEHLISISTMDVKL
jgi:hypothetical protein